MSFKRSNLEIQNKDDKEFSQESKSIATMI